MRGPKIKKEDLKKFFELNKSLLLSEDSTLKTKKEIFSLGDKFRNWYQYLINKKDWFSLKNLKEEYNIKESFSTKNWKPMWNHKDLKIFIKENKNLFLKGNLVIYDFLKIPWLSFLKNKIILKEILEDVFKQEIIFKERKIKHTSEYIKKLFNENKDKWSENQILFWRRKLKKLLSKKDFRIYLSFTYYFSYYNKNYKDFIESEGFKMKIASKQK